MENTKRKPGYYWVKIKGRTKFVIAEYISYSDGSGCVWFCEGEITEEKQFSEIDERQIVRTEPCKTVKELRIDLSKLQEIENSKFKRNATY